MLRSLIRCSLLAAACAATTLAHAAATPNLLLVPGDYEEEMGAMEPALPLDDMPESGWLMLEKHPRGATLSSAPLRRAGLAQRLREMSDASSGEATQRYLIRVPAAALAEGPVQEVELKRRALIPQLDHMYFLSLGDKPFTLTAHNGYKGRDGAHYVIETGENQRYEYLLPGFGWEHEIRFAGDMDRDGKPDFVIYVSGSNSGAWYLLLSSQARPGMNKPTATIAHGGC